VTADPRRSGPDSLGPARKTHLGWLGPVIVLVGIAASILAVWYMRAARPIAGNVIDTIAIGGTRTILVRKEVNSDRSFLELRDGNEVKWQALIPHYAGAPGRPAIAWSDKAVTVRVERDGRAEVFAFALDNAQKLGAFRLAVEHEPIEMHESGPITLTDHVRSFELVGGVDWHQLIAIDLRDGKGVWKVDLGKNSITAATVEDGIVHVHQRVGDENEGRFGGALHRKFDAATGRETPDHAASN
jgi:hypothetical protein